MEKDLTLRIRKNPYIVLTIVLALLSIILIAGNIMQVNAEVKSENEKLCSVIYATPAWSVDGKIVKYGVLNQEEIPLNVIETVLIPERIKMLYSSTCSACEQQIEYFKSTGSWEEYVKEGLAVDCNKY